MKKGKWKIIKFWDTISVDIGKYKQGWNYEVGFWVDGEIYNEEYFESKIQAQDYYNNNVNN